MNHHTHIDRVINTLKRIFRPAAYWREVYMDEDVERYHPEFGTFWQPKESGGLLLMQAQDEGYKLGYQEAVRNTVGSYAAREPAFCVHTRTDFEFRVFILHGADTEPMKVRMAIEAFCADGWDVVAMYRQDTKDDGFNRIVIGPNPQDTLTIYFRRVRVRKEI